MKFNFPLSRVKEAWSYRGEPEQVRYLGEILWRTALVIVVVGLLLAVFFSWQEMSAVTNAEVSSQTTTSAPPVLDPAKLQSALAQFSARQVQYQTVSTSPVPAVQDPSK